MKTLIPFLSLTLFITQAFSQAALSPPAPALSAGSVAPAISPVSASPSFNPPASSPNLTGTNVTISINELAPILTNLEMSIVQVLPLLSDFNDQFDFVNISQGGQQVSGTGTSSSTLFSMNPALSTGTAVHVSGAVSASNSFLLPPGLAGLGTTNGLRTITLTRDTLRALLVLQADMERMLPVLDAVNGGTNFITVGVTDTGAANTLR